MTKRKATSRKVAASPPPAAPPPAALPTAAPPQPPYLYNDFVLRVATTFDAALSWMAVVHNFEYGDEFEVALCKILRSILPMKYGICRGYAVNIHGQSEGNDIIIYDRMGFPTLRSLEGADYSRREQIPIEAIYAYIEAKHALQLEGTGESSLQHAIDQVCKVKRLCAQRDPVPVAGGPAPAPSHWPAISNPPYGAIISRHVRRSEGAPVLERPEEIRDGLVGAPVTNEFPPDLVVAGRNNLLLPVIWPEGTPQPSMPSPFLLQGQSTIIPQIVPNVAFGAGTFVLLWALAWLRPGEMRWPDILNDCLTRYPVNPT